MAKNEKKVNYNNLLIKQISKIDGREWVKQQAKEGIKKQEIGGQIYPIVEYLIEAFKNKIEDLEHTVRDLERKIDEGSSSTAETVYTKQDGSDRGRLSVRKVNRVIYKRFKSN